MPVYEYECPKCQSHLEETISIHDEIPTPTCWGCGAVMVRLYNFGAVTFNGSGFYKTDK